jgi:hypothetical protein
MENINRYSEPFERVGYSSRKQRLPYIFNILAGHLLYRKRTSVKGFKLKYKLQQMGKAQGLKCPKEKDIVQTAVLNCPQRYDSALPAAQNKS